MSKQLRLRLTIKPKGDVSGKGVKSAMYAVLSYGILHAEAKFGASPAHMLWVLNDELRARISERMNCAMCIATISEIQIVVEEMIAEADMVVNCGSFRGKFQDITQAGVPVTTTGVSVYRIQHGKIVEERSIHDALGLLEQLGVVSI
ncbi:MAG: ester cyclase [Candidatus Poribacteria bacterium]|nr:ester cyclase [Candidatus Poribacteria bacterium]